MHDSLYVAELSGGLPTNSKARQRLASGLRVKLEEVRDLPTLPIVALKVMGMASDPDGNLSRMVELIETDVALTGKILKTANSAYFGVPRKVGSLKTALVVIGLDEIGKLVTTVSILKMFPSYSDASSFGKRFWYHNAAVAEMTVALYDSIGLPRPSSTFAASLLHDVGRLVLYEYFRPYHQQLEDFLSKEAIPIYVAEMQLLGVDHGQIGAWLLEKWNLPVEIIDAVAQHHVRPADSPRYGLADMIDHADQIFYLMEPTDPFGLFEQIKEHTELGAWFNFSESKLSALCFNLYKRRERAELLLAMLR